MRKRIFFLNVLFIIVCLSAFAQPGIADIDAITGGLKDWWWHWSDLSLVLAGIFGTLAGLRIYRDWNLGLREITWPVTRWLLAAIFMVSVNMIVSKLFI